MTSSVIHPGDVYVRNTTGLQYDPDDPEDADIMRRVIDVRDGWVYFSDGSDHNRAIRQTAFSRWIGYRTVRRIYRSNST